MAFNQSIIFRAKQRFWGWQRGPIPDTIPPAVEPPDTRNVRAPVFTRLWTVSALTALLAQPVVNLNTTTLAVAEPPAEAEVVFRAPITYRPRAKSIDPAVYSWQNRLPPEVEEEVEPPTPDDRVVRAGVFTRNYRRTARPDFVRGFTPPTVAAAYDLLAAAGSYNIVGQDSLLVSARTLDANIGAYTVSGQDALLTAARLLAAAPGSYTISGFNSLLTAARTLDAATASYVITPADALLLASRTLDAGIGSYLVVGYDGLLTVEWVLAAQPGSYALGGFNAILFASTDEVIAYVLRAPITYRPLGPRFNLDTLGWHSQLPPVALEELPPRQTDWPNPRGPLLNLLTLGMHVQMPPEEFPASFVHQILDVPPGRIFPISLRTWVDWNRFPVLAAYDLLATAGAYSISGQPAGLLAHRVLDAATAFYSVNGPVADLVAARILEVAPGTYSISPKDSILTAARILDAIQGSYSIVGKDITGITTRLLDAAPGSYAIVGKNADVVAGRVLNATPGVYNLTGRDAATLTTYVLAANPGSYAIVGRNAILIYSEDVTPPTLDRPLITIINIIDITNPQG